MSNYTPLTNFTSKDSLPTGDPQKVILGSDVDAEFSAISTAISTKLENVAGATAGHIATLSAAGGIQNSGTPITDLTNFLSNFTGMVCSFAAATAPPGWVACDGSILSTTSYAELFAVIGYTYGGSGGSFTLPDLRDDFIRGASGTRSVGDRESWAIENINATIDSRNNNNDASIFTGGSGAFSLNSTGGGTGAANTDINSGSTSESRLTFDASNDVQTASETRPRNVTLLWCIKKGPNDS